MIGTLWEHIHASDVFLKSVIELLEAESAGEVTSPETNLNHHQNYKHYHNHNLKLKPLPSGVDWMGGIGSPGVVRGIYKNFI